MKEERKQALGNALNVAKNLQLAIQEIMNEENSEVGACQKYNIRQMSFRTILFNPHLGYVGEKPKSQEIDDILFSGGERLYKAMTGEGYQRIPYDVDDTFEYIFEHPEISNLNERYVKMLKMYYWDCMTLDEVGKEFNLTRERVRQSIAKSERILKHPARFKIIRYGVNIYKQQLEERKAIYGGLRDDYSKGLQEKLSKAIAENSYDKVQSLMRDAQNYLDNFALNNPEYAEKNKIGSYRDLPIDSLEFSCRSYNCLRRCGVKTIGDLLEIKEDDLYKVRNLGKKSMKEILDVVHSKGFKFDYESVINI